MSADLKHRERYFARFLRGVARNAELVNHPAVREFLKVDHAVKNKNKGMQEFSKNLQKMEKDLASITTYFFRSKMDNQVYRVSSHQETIGLDKDFFDRLDE